MVTIEEYLGQRNTPMRHSPTAQAMRKLLQLCPTLAFEEARTAVNVIGASTCETARVAQEALKLIQRQKAFNVAA
jgi:hypothetical protein